jgi:hypothetical protein
LEEEQPAEFEFIGSGAFTVRLSPHFSHLKGPVIAAVRVALGRDQWHAHLAARATGTFEGGQRGLKLGHDAPL